MKRILYQFCEIQPKIHYLGLIKREHQTNPNRKSFCKMTVLNYKKNVKVMKIREKRRSNSRAKRTREIRQLSDPGWGPLAREGITGTDHWIKDTQELFALALQHLYAWNCFKRKEYKYHLLLEDCWSLPFVASGPCSNFGCLVQFVYSSAFPLDCELLEFLDWALFISISLEPRQWPKHRKHS